VVQSLGRDDKRAQGAPQVPKGIATKQAASQIRNNHPEKADTSPQIRGVGLEEGIKPKGAQT